MARERKEEAPPGAPMWLATYGDLVTLILCFFVLLYSFSSPNQELLEAFTSVFQQSEDDSIIDFGNMGITEIMGNGIVEFPTPSQSTDPILEESEEAQQAKIDDYIGDVQSQLENAYASPYETYFDYFEGAPEITVSVEEGTTKIEISADAFFLSGSAEIEPGFDITVLANIILETFQPGSVIEVEGHTDSVPMSSGRYRDNWDLSSNRARAVILALMEATGLEGENFKSVGLSEYFPIADNETEEGRRLNRRVVIYMSTPAFN
ncbi:MAG: flagellar motor protein MotB [Clostridiales bacterium]|jgi:chemotaxis protein MotB|nr:flagellar motor protein MotB [Clostridiales bacterium]